MSLLLFQLSPCKASLVLESSHPSNHCEHKIACGVTPGLMCAGLWFKTP